MAEYIEREAVLELFQKYRKTSCMEHFRNDYGVGLRGASARLEQIVRDAPAADAAPVRRGRWVDNVDENGFLCNVWRKCSACGGLNYSKKPPYYPNCGADMRGE